MSIRVVCNECHSASQVVDDAAGFQAMCPFCESVFSVPAPGSLSEPQPKHNAEATSKPQATPSPFLTRRPLTATPIEWGQIDPRVASKIAVQLYKAHPQILAVSHLIFFTTFVGLSLGLETLAKSGQAEIAGILQMLSIPITMFLQMGLTIVTLRVARDEETDVTAMLSGADRLVRVVLFNAMLTVLVCLTSIAFLVPGIYLALRFWSGSHFIIDQNCGVFEAFGLAGRHSEGNRIPSLMLALISVGIFSLVAPSVLVAPVLGLLPFFATLILILPLFTLLWTVSYLMLTRQPIQLPNLDGPLEKSLS